MVEEFSESNYSASRRASKKLPSVPKGHRYVEPPRSKTHKVKKFRKHRSVYIDSSDSDEGYRGSVSQYDEDFKVNENNEKKKEPPKNLNPWADNSSQSDNDEEEDYEKEEKKNKKSRNNGGHISDNTQSNEEAEDDDEKKKKKKNGESRKNIREISDSSQSYENEEKSYEKKRNKRDSRNKRAKEHSNYSESSDSEKDKHMLSDNNRKFDDEERKHEKKKDKKHTSDKRAKDDKERGRRRVDSSNENRRGHRRDRSLSSISSQSHSSSGSQSSYGSSSYTDSSYSSSSDDRQQDRRRHRSGGISEKEKMLAGELYDAFDPVLLHERNQAKELCFRFNQTSPLDTFGRQTIIKQLLNGVDDAVIESPFNVDYGYNLRLGRNFYANHGCTILDCNLITIGDNCLLAPHVCISASTHPLSPERRADGEEYTAPITLGNNVWIGANATICPNVTLGDGVVVGAGAVVTKSFPSYVVVAGVPAKIIKNISPEKALARKSTKKKYNKTK